MRLELVPRTDVSLARRVVTPVAALVVALAIGGLIVAAMGASPRRAFSVYVVEPLTQGWVVQELLVKGAPLILIAVGLAFCFRANRWNIGAEGQFVAGGIAGGAVAIATYGSGAGGWVIVAMLAAGTLGGIAYALLPAILRTRFGASEILTSLMLVYVAQLALDYLARGPWRDPRAFNFPQSVRFEPNATLPFLLEGERVHLGVAFALAAAVVAWVVLERTRFGFMLRATGEAPRAAAFGGSDERRMTLVVFAVSGALAGLAGICEVAGQIGQIQPSISPGYGFTAIIVAFLGRLSPPAIVVAGLALALILIGAEGAQISLRLPLDVARVFQGILLFCILAGDVLTRNRLRLAV